MRIVYMGTPDFAVPTLQALLDSPHQVVGVFSQPDRPKGRGYKLMPPPVKELALAHGVPVYQPVKMRDGTALAILKQLRPDVIVVAAYGRLLPKEILELPAYGCINVHASLLPRYRGAGPVQWSVINGEKATGVTTMFMGEGLDTGDILEQVQTPIGPEETAWRKLARNCFCTPWSCWNREKRFGQYRMSRWRPTRRCFKNLTARWIFRNRLKSCMTESAGYLPGRPLMPIWTASGSKYTKRRHYRIRLANRV